MSGNSAKRKVLFLHTGMPKTGSTEIQRFLADNAELFQQLGYLVPLKGVHRADQHRYSWKSSEGVANYTSPLIRMPATDWLWERLGQDPSLTSHDLIISAEGFYWDFRPGLAARKLAWIQQCLPNHQVKILIYLRDEVELLTSIRNEWVKTGFLFNNRYVETEVGSDSPNNFYSAFLAANLCDYAGWVDCVAKLIGPENLTVRIYDRSQLIGQDISRDFIDALGIDASNGFVFRSDDANPREDDHEIFSILEALSKAAHDLPHRSRSTLHKAIRTVRFEAPTESLGDAPTNQAVAELLACVAASNDTLCPSLFPTRKQLFSRKSPDETLSGRNQVVPQVSVAKVAAMLSEIWRAREEQATALNRETGSIYRYARELVRLLKANGINAPELMSLPDEPELELTEAIWQRKLGKLSLILARQNIGTIALWGYNDLGVAIFDNLPGSRELVRCFIDRVAQRQNIKDELREVPVVGLADVDLDGIGAVVLCTEKSTASMMAELETRSYKGNVISYTSL